MISRFLLTACLLAFCSSLAAADLGPTTRVAVVRQAPKVSVSSQSGLKVKSPDGMKVLHQRGQGTVVPGATAETLSMDGVEIPNRALLVPGGASVVVNGRAYRGYLRVVRDGSGVTAVNVLPMEVYIRSVLGGEIGASWPYETLKAHAVASRSYAHFMLANPRHPDYDLAATTLDQVYPGVEGESSAITGAVQEVANQVLISPDGRVVKSFYSSNCGGHTADSETVFAEDHVPLRGVPDRFCAGAPNSSWTVRIPVSEVISSLSKAGYPLSPGARLASAVSTGRDRSGRIEELVLHDSQGRERRLNGQNLRKALGYQRLRGTRAAFSTDRPQDPTVLIFTGSGWGHGVGLCQWGAYEMGRTHSYRDLLGHYYPDMTIEARPSR